MDENETMLNLAVASIIVWVDCIFTWEECEDNWHPANDEGPGEPPVSIAFPIVVYCYTSVNCHC